MHVMGTPQSYRVRSFKEFIGNAEMKAYFLAVLASFLLARQTGVNPLPKGERVMLMGESRTGKTEMVNLFLQAVSCLEFNLESQSLCKLPCRNCAYNFHIDGDAGLFAEFSALTCSNLVINHIPIDCTKLTSAAQLKDYLALVSDKTIASQGTTIVFMDECHRLARWNMDHMILKAIEQSQAFFILASAEAGQLEQMLINRCVVLSTETAEPDEFENWIISISNQYDIQCEAKAVIALGKKAEYKPGLALNCLTKAMRLGGVLTERIVQEWRKEI